MVLLWKMDGWIMDDTFWMMDGLWMILFGCLIVPFFFFNLVDQSETPIGAQKVSPTPPRTQ